MVKKINEDYYKNLEHIFLDAQSSCDGTLADLANQLWRHYVDEEDAIRIIKDFYDTGRLKPSIMRDIRILLNNGETIEDVVNEEYFYANKSYDIVKPYFGRV